MYKRQLLNRLTDELDKTGKELEEATELLNFVSEEWKILRNQLEAAMIKSDDEERVECEASVAKAHDEVAAGNVDQCLAYLSTADDLMEKLRRRI